MRQRAMRHLRILIAVIATAPFVAAPAARAQGTEAYSATLTAKKLPISISDHLTLSLNGLKTGGDYILGFKLGGKPVLAAAQVQTTSPHPGMQTVSGMTDWSNVSISTATVRVDGLDSLQGALMLYTVVPNGADITVKIDGSTVAHFRPSEDTVVRNGTVTTMAQGLNFGKLVIELTSPPQQSNAPEVVQSQSGAFFATPAALKSHVTSFRLPNPSATTENEMMKIQISESGGVVSASPAAGSYTAGDTFGPACESALLEWHFRPFTFEGKAVPVSAVVTLVSENGKVQTTVSTQ